LEGPFSILPLDEMVEELQMNIEDTKEWWWKSWRKILTTTRRGRYVFEARKLVFLKLSKVKMLLAILLFMLPLVFTLNNYDRAEHSDTTS
jgi:hypothetical protein